MILSWFIGVLLCLLCIGLLKNLRKRKEDWPKIDYKPILRVWHVILISILGLIPVVGLTVGIVLLIVIVTSYSTKNLKWQDGEKPGRLSSFLNRTIE